MITFKCTVADEHGIHARPAGLLVNCAKKFESDITVSKNGQTADVKRLLSFMALGAKHGEELTFTVDGKDESTAAEELKKVFMESVG